jgi:metallo-beta-lactamase family protein
MDLCSVMLPDSGYIQELEVENLNRRNARRGRRLVSPIYTADEAVSCLTQFRPLVYREWVAVAERVRARFWNAGHLLGSASVEVEVAADEEQGSLRILFSGDIGPDAKLLHPDPEAPTGFDYVVCECTYGNTDRQETSPAHRRRLLSQEVRAAQKSGGALLIPSFAVERTQELLVDLVELMDADEISPCLMFIDSPLATKASAIFERHAGDMEEGAALVRALNSHRVRFTESVEQSKALDRLRNFHVVIAASGMCEAGRIRHRLKNWLWRHDATVLMVGYQAEGTLGRVLLDGAPAVLIQGDEVKVRARIRSIDLYSGHADGPELCNWVQKRLPIRGNLFLVHGEKSAADGLRDRLSHFIPAASIQCPELDDLFNLSEPRARLGKTERRIDPAQVGRPDWHNDFSNFLLDVNEAMERAADERARGVILRRLQRALEEPGT